MRYLLILLLFLSFACNNKNQQDYYDLYAQRVLWQAATTPPPDSQNACIAAMQSAEICLQDSSDAFFYGTLNETTIAAIFSDKGQFTYSDYCSARLSADTYSKYSESAKECLENCQKEYWTKRKSDGQCTATFSENLTGLSEGSQDCNLNCFKTTDSEIPYQ